MQFPPAVVSAYDGAMKRAVVLLVLLACCRPKTNKLPDEAWGRSDYATAGLAIDKPWVAADFTNAVTVLKRVTEGHRERLPRYQGAKSGEVFAKLLEPLAPDADKPIGERFGAHAERAEAANQMSKLYVENAYAVPTREWIELTGVVMRQAALLIKDSDTFVASFGADDPKREVRLDGLAKMKRGYGTMMLGGLYVAGDTRVSEADRTAMIKHVTAALPTMFPVAPAETQTQIRDQAKLLVDKLPKGALRDAVIEAQHALP